MVKRLPVKASLKSVRQHRYILKKIANASAKDRKTMFKNAPNQLFSVIKTLFQLVSNGNLKLGKAQKHKKLAEKISTANLKTIKASARQGGGAIAAIIGGILPFLAPLIAKLFK